MNEVYLKDIAYNGGKISFGLSPIKRLDRKEYISGSLNNSLENITIFDNHNNEVKKIKFNTSYYNNDKSSDPDKEKYLRLKLDEVIFFSYKK